MKKYIIYTILAMATLANCQKYEEVDIAQSTQTLSVSLSDDDTTTRVSLTDGESSVTLDWESNDVFTIYTTDGGRVADFKYSSKNDDGTIIFASTDATTLLSDGIEYIAIYPSIDGVTTLDAHRAELESRLSEQTQTGNSNNNHLENALRMEAEFTYSAISDTKVIFEHQMATMRLTFATEDGAIPTKIVFSDGDYMSYTVNFDGATEASSYTAHFVIKPNKESLTRELELTIVGDSYTGIFSVESETVYSAGVQYRSVLSTDDFSTYDGMLIYTKADLIAFRDAVNGGDNTINAWLMADIDLSEEEWTPIGTSSTTYYAGTFDGNGYKISNLTVDIDSSYAGLFGCIDGGCISNCILYAPKIHGASCIGAFCGYLSDGNIYNCSVMSNYVSGFYCVGGVVGEIKNSSVIEDCYTTGSVSGVGSYTGGVIGYVDSSSVISCYNTGSVYCSDNFLGGVIGYACSLSTVKLCNNSGSVNSTSGNVGGVIGYIDSSSVEASYNTGVIQGKSRVGGVVGQTTTSSIVACYNKGDISANDGYYAGGIAGFATGDSFAVACYNIGQINGSYYVGGVVGYALNSFSIENCYNTAYVEGSSKIGGIIGGVQFASVVDSYYLKPNGTTYDNTYGIELPILIDTMTSINFISNLNTTAGGTYWGYDTNNINNGYPILVSIDYQ